MRHGRFITFKTSLREAGGGRESASRWDPFPFYTHDGGATFLPDWGDEEGSPGGATDPRDSARGDTAANTPGPSQAGPHRVAAESHRHPRGERPAEQSPCRQHRGGQHSHLPLSPSLL